MRTISLEDLHKRARSRPPGYAEDVLSRAYLVTQTHYTISEDTYVALAAKYRTSGQAKVPVIDTSPVARLRRANLILHVQYPVLANPEQYTERYLSCQRCEKAKRDNLGYAVGCSLCGCGSDTLTRRWRVLNAECGDRDSPRWQPGEYLKPSSE